MNHLFSMGKDLLKNKDDGDHHSSSGGSGLNPLAMFKQLDRNGDGKITEEDFILVINKLGLGTMGDQAVKTVFRQVDSNRNGVLDLSEAIAAYEKIKKLLDASNKAPSH